MKAVVCHRYPSVHTSSLGNVHSSESLIWFHTSGFCCIISAVLLLVILLPWVMEIPLDLDHTSPFMCSNSTQMA